MRAVIFALAGILSGYVVGKLEYESFEEIVERLSSTSSKWFDAIVGFIGETVKDIEGFDSDQIKVNIDSFIDGLYIKIEEVSNIKSFNEKVSFIEDEITNITAHIIEKSKREN